MKSFHFFIGIALLLSSSLAIADIEQQPRQKQAEPPPQPVLTKAPVLISTVEATYPQQAIDEKIEGAVAMLIDIDATGTVTKVMVTQSPHGMLSEAAQQAVLQFKFSPAEIDNKPSPIRIEYTYHFTLQSPKDAQQDSLSDEPPPITGAIKGTILEAGWRRAMAGASIILEGTSFTALADGEGTFTFSHVTVGRYPLIIEAVGYDSHSETISIQEDKLTSINVYLTPIGNSPYHTVVRGKQNRSDITVVTLGREELKQVPGTFGDPLRVIENLPGMNRTPGGLGGALLIRGSSPQDSAVYLDGVEIPILYHFGGLTSVVNAEFLEDIDFIPGGFGASYGDVIAGIVDVNSRQLEIENYRGNIEIDLIDAGVFLSIPINEKWQIAVAARRSYIDALLPPIVKAVAGDGGLTLAPRYYDYQFKASYKAAKDKLDIFFFGSDDKFRLIQTGDEQQVSLDFGLHTAFHRMLINHRHVFNKQLTLHTRPYIGIDLLTFDVETQAADTFNTRASLTTPTFGIREELTYQYNKYISLLAGIEWQIGHGKVESEIPVFDDLSYFPSAVFDFTETQEYNNTIYGYFLAGYVEAQIFPIEDLQCSLGLRGTRYKLENNLGGSIEPRVSVKYKYHLFSENLLSTMKLAWGLYQQAPQPYLITNEFGNPNLAMEKAYHYVIGFEQQLTALIDLSLELFYVDRFNLVTFSDNYTIDENSGIIGFEFYNNDAIGYSYGFELLIRHSFSRYFYGWLAYTFSQTKLRDHPGDDYYLGNLDQTHILTLVAQASLWWGINFGVRYRFVSGNPYTPITSAIYDSDVDAYTPIYGDINTDRLRPFHQLDVRIDKKFIFEKWILTIYLEVLNAYNAKNIESYNYDYRYRERVEINSLPIFPVLGIKGEF